MLTGLLSPSTIGGLIRAGDSSRFNLDLSRDRAKIVDSALRHASIPTGMFKDFSRPLVNGKRCVSLHNYNDHLILRAVSRYLRNEYSISFPDRNRTVRGVIEALRDATPLWILRRDIQTFYESINASQIRDKILADPRTPPSIADVLDTLFSRIYDQGSLNLPRGVSISAILAEMALTEFDNAAKKIHGVYRYFRYADDIVVFAYEPANLIAIQLDDALPKGLQFNTTKLQDISLSSAKSSTLSSKTFQFLGYSFMVLNGVKPKSARTVHVTISSKKINRLKSRTILSLLAFDKSPDFQMLFDRMRFLSGNYRVRRTGQTHGPSPKFVKSGIYYNYSFCGTYEGDLGYKRERDYSGDELKALDGFYHSLTRGANSQFRSILRSSLNVQQRRQLTRMSFLRGFTHRITHRFTPRRVAEIKEVWKNA